MDHESIVLYFNIKDLPVVEIRPGEEVPKIHEVSDVKGDQYLPLSPTRYQEASGKL
jgi:hypothetical protein